MELGQEHIIIYYYAHMKWENEEKVRVYWSHKFLQLVSEK